MIFSLKTKVIGGRGCLEQLGETVEGFGVKKALLCTDAFLAGTPAASRIVEMLGCRGIRCPVYTRLQPEPIDVHCDEGARFCAENGVELIVALGGGSVMDQSKAMAAIVTNGLPVRQLEDRPIPKRMLPLVCVPTTAGTGSEVTFVSVITNTDEQRKMTIMDADSLSPDVAICDPELLTTLPRGLIASCGVDALTHAIESFTSLPANPISDALALRAMELIAANLPRCWQDPSDLQAQGSMMLASTMAGAAFINADVGAVHALAETVGAFFHIPHGVANSLFLPYIMEFSRVGNAALYARVARQLGAAGPGTDDETAARGAVAFVEGLVRRLEIPAFASFKNVDPARFEELARRAAMNPMNLDNRRPMGPEDHLAVLRQAWEGRTLS